MKFLYHYCATYQESSSTISNLDGVIESDNKIDSSERYMEIKKSIKDFHKVSVCVEQITISSIYLLHENK